MTVEQWLGEDNKLGKDIWEKKYRYNGESFDEWLDRVSGGDKTVVKLILEKKAIFGGRILSNRGTGLNSSYSNCYVLPSDDIDSIEGILEQCKRMASTFKAEGGLGFDLSAIRPKGAKVNSDKAPAPGPVSFMPLFSSVTGTIASGGRRGASLLFINARHPDAIEFCKCKRDKNNGITNANISLMIDDEFMSKAKDNIIEDAIWHVKSTGEDFAYKLDYKAVIDEAVTGGLIGAEPACLFKDHYINNTFTQNIPELTFTGVNGCSEFAGTDWAACMLASMNISAYVNNGVFNEIEFFNDTFMMFDALNDVLEEGFELHPYEEMKVVAKEERQVGMGITGLADAMIKLGLTYGSQESKEFTEVVGKVLLNACVRSSANRARTKGVFKYYNDEKVKKSQMFNMLDDETQELVKECGLYNSRLVAVAPQGTGSLLLGCSTGIEPVYKRVYNRRTQSLHGEDVIYAVTHRPIVDYMQQHNLTEIPSHCVEAHDIHWRDKLDIIASLQKYCDNAISNTTNLPKGTTFEELKEIYFYGHSIGCKGISVYVDGSLDSQVLFDNDSENISIIDSTIKEVDESKLYARRVKLKHGCGAFTVHAYFYEGKIYDIFVSTKQAGCISNIQSVAVLLSLGLRKGLSLEDIKKSLSGITSCSSYNVAKSKDSTMDMSATSCSTMLINKLLLIQESELNSVATAPMVNSDIEFGIKCKVCGNTIELKDSCTTCPKCNTVNCG